MKECQSILIVHQNWIESFSISRQLKRNGYHVFGCYDDMYEAITSIHRDENPPDVVIYNLDKKNLKSSFSKVSTFQFLYERPILITTGMRSDDILPFMQNKSYTRVLFKPFTFSQLEKRLQRLTQLHNQFYAEKSMPFT